MFCQLAYRYVQKRKNENNLLKSSIYISLQKISAISFSM